MKTKIREQTFTQSQESGYMWRWITVSDNQQDESSKETSEYNHSMNSSLKKEQKRFHSTQHGRKPTHL